MLTLKEKCTAKDVQAFLQQKGDEITHPNNASSSNLKFSHFDRCYYCHSKMRVYVDAQEGFEGWWYVVCNCGRYIYDFNDSMIYTLEKRKQSITSGCK